MMDASYQGGGLMLLPIFFDRSKIGFVLQDGFFSKLTGFFKTITAAGQVIKTI